MKWTCLIPLAAFAVTVPAALPAQDTIKPAPPPTQSTPQMNQFPQQQDSSWAQKRTSQLLKGITLTAEQKQKVDSIQAKYRDQLPAQNPAETQRPNDPTRQDPNYPRTQQQQPDSAQQSMLLMILERQDTEIRTALKPDQQKVFDKNKQELKMKRTPVG
jgi:hypothetical protein